MLGMALSWQPDAGSLQQIMILLTESQSTDNKIQQALKPVSWWFFTPPAVHVFSDVRVCVAVCDMKTVT